MDIFWNHTMLCYLSEQTMRHHFAYSCKRFSPTWRGSIRLVCTCTTLCLQWQSETPEGVRKVPEKVTDDRQGSTHHWYSDPGIVLAEGWIFNSYRALCRILFSLVIHPRPWATGVATMTQTLWVVIVTFYSSSTLTLKYRGFKKRLGTPLHCEVHIVH